MFQWLLLLMIKRPIPTTCSIDSEDRIPEDRTPEQKISDIIRSHAGVDVEAVAVVAILIPV